MSHAQINPAQINPAQINPAQVNPAPPADPPASRVRPRGRPQRLPMDANSASSGKVDTTRRLAWLMATNRLMAGTQVSDDRGAFVAGLHADAIVADSPRLSRLESGTARPSRGILESYERQLGLPACSLSAAEALMRRTAGGSVELTAASPGIDYADLDGLFDRLDAADGGDLAQPLTGADWLRLASGLATTDRAYLHTHTWDSVCARLIRELTRASGIAQTRRYEAAALLLTHPQATRHLSRCLGEFVMDDDVQNVTPALTLLREVGDTAAADLTLRLILGENPLLRRGASVAAGGLAARNSFEEASLARLVKYVRRELRRPGRLGERVDLFDLIVHLPTDALERVLEAAPNPRARTRLTRIRETRLLVAEDRARTVADRVAGRAEHSLGRQAHDPDMLLRTLIGEGLFHAERERRHLACALIGASPYAAGVAQAVLELTVADDETTARMAWSMLRRLGHVLPRATVAEAIETVDPGRRPGHLAHGLVTLGLAHGALGDPVAARAAGHAKKSERDGVRHAALFAIGMSGHPRLSSLAKGRGADAAGARWWVQVGSCLHDDDVLRAG